MFTKPEYQRLGIGSELIKVIIAHAKASVMQIHLNCTTKNDLAIDFYKKHGFKIYGTEPRALKISNEFYDMHLMVLELA